MRGWEKWARCIGSRVAPALELIGLYHERWEVELVIDEIKTPFARQPPRAQTALPEVQAQEASSAPASPV